MEKCFNSEVYPDCHYIRIQIDQGLGKPPDIKTPKTRDELINGNKCCSAHPCQYGKENRLCEIRNRLLDIRDTLQNNAVNSRQIEKNKANALAEMILLSQKMIPDPRT